MRLVEKLASSPVVGTDAEGFLVARTPKGHVARRIVDGKRAKDPVTGFTTTQEVVDSLGRVYTLSHNTVSWSYAPGETKANYDFMKPKGPAL